MSKVNGELWELGRPLEADCELQLLGFDTTEGKQVITQFPAVNFLSMCSFPYLTCKCDVDEK